MIFESVLIKVASHADGAVLADAEQVPKANTTTKMKSAIECDEDLFMTDLFDEEEHSVYSNRFITMKLMLDPSKSDYPSGRALKIRIDYAEL